MFGLLCLGFLAVSAPTAAGQASSGALEYQLTEVMIPMRDGVELYTQIFEPVGLDEPYPILFTRTPYGVAPLQGAPHPGTLGPSPAFAAAGYVFVHQDARGQFQSQGEWELVMPLMADRSVAGATDESTDAYDTIEWLLANVEGHNGRVGMWGISYDAWEAVMALVDAHPALLAVSPQASPADMFVGDDLHHNGAFRLAYSYAWLAYMSVSRGDANPAVIGPTFGSPGYEFFLSAGSLMEIEERYFAGAVPEWIEVLEHSDYDDYWQSRNPLPHLKDVQPAVLNVAGWFDAEDFRGPIDIYQQLEESDDEGRNSLVVGPWFHGGWGPEGGVDGSSLGDLDFEQPTSEFFQEFIELPFFEHHLRDGADPGLAEALVFETGGNEWREFDQWPPAAVAARSLYLHPASEASFAAPTAEAGSSEFVSDPAHPVPYTERGVVVPDPGYMVEDQRFLADREDVLTFVTEPLTEDLVLAGRVEVELHATTTGTDADWIVKVIDLYPADTPAVSAATGASLGGSQIILTGDILRAKYRTSLESPSALEPGETTKLEFVLPDRLHRFRAGHRIMVQVHSSWFPMYDRNPQVFTNIYGAEAASYQAATHRLSHGQGAASVLRLPILPE